MTSAAPGPDVADNMVSPMRQFLLRHDTWASLASAATAPDAEKADIAVALPPVPDPGKIVAAPVNYRDHQVEMNATTAIDSLGVFLMSTSARS